MGKYRISIHISLRRVISIIYILKDKNKETIYELDENLLKDYQ